MCWAPSSDSACRMLSLLLAQSLLSALASPFEVKDFPRQASGGGGFVEFEAVSKI